MQLQKSFAPPVSLSSLSSVITQQLLETNEERNLCREHDKVYLKDIYVETFDFYYFGNSYVHFWILSKIVGLNSLMSIGIFMRAMTLEAAVSVHT